MSGNPVENNQQDKLQQQILQWNQYRTAANQAREGQVLEKTENQGESTDKAKQVSGPSFESQRPGSTKNTKEQEKASDGKSPKDKKS